ncbi:MAG: helix-turn-helix transcriptional regulator [Chloroflexota bacterium]
MKNRIKMARQLKELTQSELAKQVGCTRQTIGLIEAGKFNPSLQLCVEIALALDKTLDELFWFKELSKNER